MGTTATLALRYPDATDRVADGALAMQHLAEDVDAPLGKLVTPPRCRIWQNAALNLANNVAQAVTFDSEETDASGMHNPAVNPSRITCTVAGYYVCRATIQLAASAAGFRQLYIQKNGVPAGPQTLYAPSPGTHIQQVEGELLLAVGDYIELVAKQTSGAALAFVVGNAQALWFHATYQSAA